MKEEGENFIQCGWRERLPHFLNQKYSITQKFLKKLKMEPGTVHSGSYL
jgi:hypothetical protein